MAQVAQEMRPARSLLREIPSPTRLKLPELMAIERMEDVVRRCCGRRDAQGSRRTLADDARMCSLEALLPEDPEKHLQLHRSRLTSSVVLRGEITTYCECRGHAHARKARHVQEEMTQGTLVRSDKARARASTARAKAQGSKDSKNSKTRTRTSAKTKDPNECWNCGLRGHFSKDSWSKKDAQN